MNDSNRMAIRHFLEYLLNIFKHWFSLVFLFAEIISFFPDWFDIQLEISNLVRIIIAIVFLFLSGYREYRKLKEQLNKYLDNRPNITVGFRNSDTGINLSKVKEFVYHNCLSMDIERLIKEEEERLIQKFSEAKGQDNSDKIFGNTSATIIFSNISGVVEEEEFHKKLQEYLNRLRDYYKLLKKYRFIQNIIQRVDLFIVNLGKKTPRNLTISIIIQEPITIPTDKEMFIAMEEPKKPKQPKIKRRYIYDNFFNNLEISSLALPDIDFSYPEESFNNFHTITNENMVIRTYEYDKLIASPYPIKLDELVLKFPEDTESGDKYKVIVKIKSDEIPDVINEELEFVFINK